MNISLNGTPGPSVDRRNGETKVNANTKGLAARERRQSSAWSRRGAVIVAAAEAMPEVAGDAPKAWAKANPALFVGSWAIPIDHAKIAP